MREIKVALLQMTGCGKPGHQRKGVGTALINFVRDIVRKEKMYSAFVFTNYSNKGAVEFYKSTGGMIETGDDLLFHYDD